MLLATRCPFCETVFRLQPAQLALRRGLVRCGHCHEVFDASSSLFELDEHGDFSSAKPVAAAAAIEALSGVRPKDPDFSAEAWDPWAPAPDAAIDNRLLHNASNLPLTPVSTGAGIAVTPRHATEPELPASAFTTPIPPDDEPSLASAPPDPLAHSAHAAEAPADVPSEPAASKADLSAEAAPRVWHKTERASGHLADADEPVLNEPSPLRGIPDNEPHFGAAGTGRAGPGGPAGIGAAAGAGGGSTPGPATFGSSGEPFSVQPVHDGVDPFPVVRETRPAEPRRLGWIIFGSAVAGLFAIALLAQLAWWQRETVQVFFPRSQTLYAKACAQLGCQITPPHDIDGLQVEPSDLRQIDGPHKLELKMPLRNRSNIALAYPAIELTLLDDQNNVAVRRVLWPQDYVAPGTPIAAGLPAHTTQTMIVHLDTGNAVASNFRVQIFYP
ncbi:hypothetical protein DSC91_004846 [Paraburkholderia caffeinilytica]|uniref:Zinc finger/thioredoxin putative domain-containing protein n=1 Tax=Paraburkholderia caffeinilytica TaxID=1761016 RepID=A0ABQ1N4H8_9BURK|nr:zinc-ribbon and DUF3426 domain-containing protein [Paraburkholderia caffeinilytica]AXL51987.1 hypothetical protein DSC91_004846 [Paraburkholderia caffeinilytica]GGC53811.1 hypothetical protein GCM10011400_46780 [Paraburkholderia caffeinilytica]CAB3793085.1 hypothetical protein LMG28690_03657 [Paraburkholderia caffeinilytica]